MSVVSVIIFLVYGILSPIYYHFIKPNLSNEKGFLISWTLAPFLVSYVYSFLQVYVIAVLVPLNILAIFLVLKQQTKYIWNGLLFLLLSFIIALFYKIL
ncbi:hypothetical protein DFR86_09420 [Acidianus sulfidivorans JP7]|uniref:hypothetical protein n=1 Tax=Acidianus sulfidivorans TaxID=312539 RepID=UPI0013A549E2|nr:hypothetical protein [Acidianus sulfidivorans]AWR97742.2 hypothetical protein DFR86_09420 [Acidianus sulfidivorans JP7]